jgi:hypothetical protein
MAWEDFIAASSSGARLSMPRNISKFSIICRRRWQSNSFKQVAAADYDMPGCGPVGVPAALPGKAASTEPPLQQRAASTACWPLSTPRCTVSAQEVIA